MAVSTHDVIDKAVSIDPELKEGDEKKRIHWMYKFMACKHLAVRTRTRVSQDTAASMFPVKQHYCRRIIVSYHQRINNPKLLINMDEAAVHLNYSLKCTVHSKDDRTVSIRLGVAVSTRFKLSNTVAMDGTKLPLFISQEDPWINGYHRYFLLVHLTVCSQKHRWIILQCEYGTIPFSSPTLHNMMEKLDYFWMILFATRAMHQKCIEERRYIFVHGPPHYTGLL